jgi:hypothetical protein
MKRNAFSEETKCNKMCRGKLYFFNKGQNVVSG